jgi:hypothetical protein
VGIGGGSEEVVEDGEGYEETSGKDEASNIERTPAFCGIQGTLTMRVVWARRNGRRKWCCTRCGGRRERWGGWKWARSIGGRMLRRGSV